MKNAQMLMSRMLFSRSASLVMLLVGASCVSTEDGSAEDGAMEILSELGGEPVDNAMMATIEADKDFQATYRMLEQGGDAVLLNDAVLYRSGDTFGVTIPIQHVSSGEGEYKELVYQQVADLAPSISLELAEPSEEVLGDDDEACDADEGDFHSDESALLRMPDEPSAGPTCGGWSSWYTISTYCTWHLACLGDATMLVRERWRTCCATSCYKDYQHTNVRNKCGC